MDDRRFDALTKALAAGASRRRLLKGLFGLGGAALTGSALRGNSSEAARRPTPTPKPPVCPGQQTWDGSTCVCPADTLNCGPDCCVPGIASPHPGHSECCDNACCFGTCYGEELCCDTNTRAGGLPPLEEICTSTDGTQCCSADQLCCEFDGCCDTICWGGDEFCCPEEAFCRGGGSVADVCCVNQGSQLFACCNGGTDARVCYDTTVEGACCADADCGDPCQICNPETNVCDPRCDTATQTCCTEQVGPGMCVTGACCLGVPNCGPGSICCQEAEGTICVEGNCCGNSDCPSINACTSSTCQQNRCTDTPVTCNDNNLCTVDTCDPALGCVYTQVNCDDGNPCTIDTCDPSIGCVYTPVDCSGLNDPAQCLVGVCAGGTCTTQSTCSAGTQCCGNGSCSATCQCSAVGENCAATDECCDGCCIALLATYEEWLAVCTKAGLGGPAAVLCSQTIVDSYAGTCRNPPQVVFQSFPNNPVTLPCAG